MEPSTAPPSGEAPVRARTMDEATMRRVRYAFLFVIPFLMVTMMFATYLGTMHSPEPREMPVAVVGSGVGAEALVDSLGGSEAVDARLVGSRADAVELIEAREIAGALEMPADGADEATVYTAMAAGASQASTVPQLLAPVVLEQGWTLTSEDVVPLPEGDGAGIAVLFAAMGMMLAGYVPLSVMMLGTPHLLTVRRFVPLLLGWSALTSSLIWLILGPLVGAVDGHYLQFLGIGTLATGAVGAAQLLFTKVLGPMAVLLGMLLWVVFGMPASNLALSTHMMPGFFGWLHGVLPLPAAGEALRSVVYFDGRDVGGHLVVLAIWAVVALGLSLLKERKSGTAIPAAPPVDDAETPLPALSGGPLRSKRFRYVTVGLFPLSILMMVVGLMSFSMHEPEVRELPVAVVAPTPEMAGQVAEELQGSIGSVLDVGVADSLVEAREQILEQEVVAAYVLPTEQGGSAELLSSSAAGVSQQSAVRAIFGQVAAGQQTPLEATDIAPLGDDDTMGSNSLYVGMSWIMAGFLICAVFRGGAPELRRTRQYLPFLGGWAVGMAVWLWFLFDVLVGAVNGHAWELIGFGAVTIFSVGLVTAVFTRTVGLAAIVPVMVVLMLAGVPASGGGLSIYMVPEFFRFLQDVLPLPAAVDAARSMVYFDGDGLGGNLLVIAIWGVVGLLLNLVVDRMLTGRSYVVMGDDRLPVVVAAPSAESVGAGGTGQRELAGVR